MRRFEDYYPTVVFMYFMFVTGMTMFCPYPPILGLSLVGGVSWYIVRNGLSHSKLHLGLLLLFVILSLINPVISHNGVTVLFVLNNNPVTLEALLYGVNSALMVVSALYWLCSLTQIMTSDRIMHIFGRLSPKLALLISMTLRFVPLFSRQTKKVRSAQRALGLYKDDNIIDSLRGDMRVYSIVITWALEGGIVTADSMAARGSGAARRTSYSDHHADPHDIAMLTGICLLFAVCCAAAAVHSFDFSFYPELDSLRLNGSALAGTVCYGILVFLPSAVDVEVNIRWSLLRSRV